jgi:hypothetical protein
MITIPVPNSKPKPKLDPPIQPEKETKTVQVSTSSSSSFQTSSNNTTSTGAGNPTPMSFRDQLMNRVMNRGGGGGVNTTSGPSTGGNIGGMVSNTQNQATLNQPQKDPNTGKVIIEVPEGTKDSDRLNINKIIEEANKAKAQQQKSGPVVAAKVEVPKVVTAKGGNIPKPPPINIPMPSAKPRPKPEVKKVEQVETNTQEETSTTTTVNTGGQKMDFFSQLKNVQLKKTGK